MGFYNLWYGEVKQWMTWRKMEIKIKDYYKKQKSGEKFEQEILFH
jgi:hypothetical protein